MLDDSLLTKTYVALRHAQAARVELLKIQRDFSHEVVNYPLYVKFADSLDRSLDEGGPISIYQSGTWKEIVLRQGLRQELESQTVIDTLARFYDQKAEETENGLFDQNSEEMWHKLRVAGEFFQDPTVKLEYKGLHKSTLNIAYRALSVSRLRKFLVPQEKSPPYGVGFLVLTNHGTVSEMVSSIFEVATLASRA